MIKDVEIRHFHLFCGLGGGARGFNRSQARVGNLEAKFRCIGGIDSDPAAIADFSHLVGVPGTVMDLFDREQYIAWHGKEPPADWRQAMPADIRSAAGNQRPHIIFTSPPCKGFSGLLAEKRSKGEKYQALNRLTLRGVWLALEAWQDDPPEFFLLENVPRIMNRGRHLLDQIVELLQRYGYAVAETTHDCGELGGLAQSRRRFLLVARHQEKVPPFLYEPPKRPLRAVGEILDRMPLPGDVSAGPMHRMPALHWKTWVRLAFVQAGSDWRSLKRLAVEDGYLRDYLLVPEYRADYLGVTEWSQHSGAISGRGGPTNGRYSVADPRFSGEQFGQYGVRRYDQHVGAVTSQRSPGQGPYSVADPRCSTGFGGKGKYKVTGYDDSSGTVIAGSTTGQGAFSVADPRYRSGKQSHNNVFRVIRFDQHANTVTAGHGPTAGGQAVADPRIAVFSNGYGVLNYDQSSGAVAGESLPSNGRFCVADPRPPQGPLFSKYAVTDYDSKTGTVIGGDDSGAYAVADPRPAGLNRDRGDNYLTGGHYGVIPFTSPANAIAGAARHDNGFNSVADPRLPEPNEKCTPLIIAEDNTWHRPFTTLELAAIQSLIDPDEHLELYGLSDSAWRERIGNAVPRDSAEEIGNVMGKTLLLAITGETFTLESTSIWVRPLAVALSVDPLRSGRL